MKNEINSFDISTIKLALAYFDTYVAKQDSKLV